MQPADFARLPLAKKHREVTQHGNFVAQRIYTTYNIQLFALHGYYVEVWKRIGLDYLHWIEVVKSDETLHQYTGNIDLDLDDLFS